jgi:molybdate transport system substrate-binding protein
VAGCLILAILLAPLPGGAAELTISAAISLKEVVEELGARFRLLQPGLRLRINLGGSGALQKQIEAGAPVDLFLSAGQRQMEELVRAGRIVASSRRIFARNALLVAIPAGSRLSLSAPADLLQPGVGRIALGNPKTVPAGQYAEESLRSLGLLPALQPRLVLAEDVRQALEYVARGEVEAGIVYGSDLAVRGGAVREAFRLPAESHRPILYPAAVVAASPQPELGRAFIALLMSAEGQAVLGRRGFLPGDPR